MKLRKLTTTHAGRIVLAAVPVAVVATVMMGGVAQGAVPVSFAISGSQFQISSSQLEGTGFSQYAGVANDTAGKPHQVAIANIKSASLSDLCQSVVTETPPAAKSACSSPLAATVSRRRPVTSRSG